MRSEMKERAGEDEGMATQSGEDTEGESDGFREREAGCVKMNGA